MKLLALTFLSFALISCGARRPGKTGDNGLNGANGTNGIDGYSLVVDVVTFTTVDNITCNRTDIFQDLDRNNFYSVGDAYNNGFLVCDGAVGAKGDQGIQGVAGQDGTDGTNGTNGLNADLTYSIVEIIDPCGAQHPNGYDEVILKLGNGKYLASFSDNANGKNTRFGVLPTGSYVTTDGTNCHFNIL